MKPNVLIIRTAGINCDKETAFAFRTAGAEVHLEHINSLKEKKDFSRYQIMCVPGGFSYGDDLGAGKIFSLELQCWFRDSLGSFIQRGGLAVGICNGFQVFTKTGILPDADFVHKVTLAGNDSGRFEDRWVYLRVTGQQPPEANKEKRVECVWTRNLPDVISLPVAHGEGKFYATKDILDRIEAAGQVVLRYSDASGSPAGYPDNPNGSLGDIAGITDPTGRILGLMPHPERCIFAHHPPAFRGRTVPALGLTFFQNAVEYFK